jgi:hypothetical protein
MAVYLGKKSLDRVGRVNEVLAGPVRQKNNQSRHLAVLHGEMESFGMRFDARGQAIDRHLVFLEETYS